MGKSLNFWDYVKEAFHLKVKMPLLGNFPINKLLLAGFAILGFGHPGFFFLGIAYETAYLMGLASNVRFQKFINAKELEKQNNVLVQKQSELFGTLDRNSQQRYETLFKRCMEVLKTVEGLPGGFDKKELENQGLSQLMWIFLKLLNSRIKIENILTQVDKNKLEKEIKDIEQKLKNIPEDSGMYRSLRGTYDIQIKRLENLNKADENLKVINSELTRIESQINLLKEEIAFSSDADMLTVRLDGVVDSIQGTSRWMSENAELFGSMEEQPIVMQKIDVPVFQKR